MEYLETITWLTATCCLFQTKQSFYKMRVCRANKAVDAEITLTFLSFLCENVAFEAFLVADLTGARYFETFLGT